MLLAYTYVVRPQNSEVMIQVGDFKKKTMVEYELGSV